MKKTLLALALASLTLGACSPKEEQRQEKAQVAESNCQNPVVLDDIRQQFERAIQQETTNFVLNDSRDLIDADKVHSAATQLKFSLNGVQEKNEQCSGKLSITIPKPILRTAQVNAPLLSMDNPETVIEQRMADGNFQYGNGVLSIPLTFSVKGKGQKADVQYHEDGLNASSIAVAAALLPYGVKETIVVDGRKVSREAALQALAMAAAPAPAIVPSNNQTNTATATATEQPPKPVIVETPEQKALREARVAEAKAKAEAERAALRAEKAKAAREAAEAKKLAEAKKAEVAKANDARPTETATAKPAETKPADATTNKPAEKPADKPADKPVATAEATPPVTPPVVKEEPKPQPRVSDEELDKVRQAHSKADQEIKSSWKKISPEIQKELVEEQKTWERQRTQKCRQAAAGGSDESESNKLYMQCDTRMTKERVKNLEGYSISD